MLAGILALTAAAIFTGAAVYISVAEHPARLRLEDAPLLAQWKPSYRSGFAMQASLAIVGFLLGMAAWLQTDDWRWALGACVLVSNWPYTLVAIMPVNDRLNAMPEEAPPEEARRLVFSWGRLHAVRGLLGACATVAFAWAASG